MTACSGRYTAPQEVCLRAPIDHPELIVIDAGHGGKDPGAESRTNGYEEKTLTLETAHYLENYLRQLGYNTVMTRKSDLYLTLSERAKKANALGADLFVSVHYNFSPNAQAEGVEVYYYDDPKQTRTLVSKAVAQGVLGRIIRHTGAHSRGVKDGNFAVIRETKMAAILVEGGFLSHPGERRKLKDPQYIQYLAWGIARGIDHHFEK